MCRHSRNVGSLQPRLRTTKLAEYWGIARLALDQAEDRPPSVIRQAIPNDRFWAKQLGAASPAVDPSATLAVVISSPESGRSKPRTRTPVAAQCIAVFTKDVPTALPVIGHRMRRCVQVGAVHRIHHVVDHVAVVDLRSTCTGSSDAAPSADRPHCVWRRGDRRSRGGEVRG